MSDEIRQRTRLLESLAPTIGREAAVQLMDAIPPAAQLTALADQVDARFTALERQLLALQEQTAELQRQTAELQRQTAELQRQVALQDQHTTDRFALVDERINGLRNEVLAAFRGELVAAVSGQTRHVIVATAMAVFGIGGLAVTLAQVLS